MRVGFHSGPVISHAADVFGDTVNVAARVVAHAKPGQILVAKQTVRRLPKEGAARFVGSIQVKGKNAPLELYEIVWDHENLTMVQGYLRGQGQRHPADGDLRRRRRSRWAPIVRCCTWGADPRTSSSCPIPLASRVHARIEYRHDRFLLIDQSLNGTYVQMQGAGEVALRRDEIVLERSGLISLGKSVADHREQCLKFTVQRTNQVSDRSLMRRRAMR